MTDPETGGETATPAKMWPKETHRRPGENPPRRPPLDRDREPQTQAQGLLANVLARRNWEHTRSINVLRERDCHQSGETAEVRRTSPASRTPPDRDRAPQPRAHERRRLYADLLARRNGEYMKSLHVLREQDRQLAGETTEVTVGSAGELNPKSLDVEVETQRSLVGDGRTIRDSKDSQSDGPYP